MSQLIPRRLFCRFAVLGSLAATIPPVKDEPSAALLYEQGVRMLREGRTFEKAQAHFARAAETEPTNPEYPIALGCACACRVASLAWAGSFAERLAIESAAYPKWKTEFAAREAQARQDLKAKDADAAEVKKFNDAVEKAKRNSTPPIGRVFLMKDDKKNYGLTPAELMERLTTLNKQALAAWEKGVALCKTPEEKAHAQYVRGWGMRLLKFYCEDESRWRKNVFSQMLDAGQEPLPPLGVESLPTDKQINAAFREATEIMPGAALYWQARADALTAGELLNPGAEATDLYRKAARLDPKNANLWSRVYDRETTIRWQEKPIDAPDALDDLHHAQTRDKANAWYGYEEAGRIIKTASWNRSASLPYDATDKEQQVARETPRTEAGYAAAKRAVTLIERANNMPRYVPPVYQNSVPVLLARAWGYVPVNWYEVAGSAFEARFRELGRTCGGYAESLVEDKKNLGEAVRVLRIVQAMGLHITGGEPWPTGYDLNGKMILEDTAVMHTLVGTFMVSVAFSGLVGIVKKIGDEEMTATITREQAEWRARVKKWIATLPKEEDTPSLYALYDRV